MRKTTLEEIVAEAERLFEMRHHCSEAIVIATGGYYLDPLPEILIRASCPFGGGIGGCREEVCGLVSGATLVLGALWGRTTPQEDDHWLYEVVCEYRRRFIAAYGTTQCAPLREQYEAKAQRCTPLVKGATRMLLEIIEEVADRMPEKAQRLAHRVSSSTIS